MQQKVKGTISEKSFYSYFKNAPDKLPRIDILNLLSQYCGYENWNAFKMQNAISENKTTHQASFKKIALLVIIVVMGISSFFYITKPKEHTFSFCFIDQDRNLPITSTPIDIIILNNSESSFRLKSNKEGCFSWKTKDKFIQFAVQSPYHKSDTIYRSIGRGNIEKIIMQTDDYALMLHYYANGKVQDWKQRKAELSKLIAADATILQVLPYGLGVEIYSKQKFINTLTTPTQSLKNIEIINSQKVDGQIVKLKFKVKS